MNTGFEGVDRILIRGVNWVGDTILTYPAVERLKKGFPQSHLAVLVRESLVDLWKTFPYVDEVIPFQPRKGWRSLGEDLRLGFSLRKEKFDLAVVFPRSFRSAYQIFLARIPIRLGYRDEGRFLFLTHGIPRDDDVVQGHRIQYYQRLLDTLGMDERIYPPRVFLREEDRRWAKEKLERMGLLDGRPLIGYEPGRNLWSGEMLVPGPVRRIGKETGEEVEGLRSPFWKGGGENDRPGDPQAFGRWRD